MSDVAAEPLATSVPGNSGIDVETSLETYRGELTGYCYRMLGSAFEAEDAVQETMIRAWRAADRFEGRSSLRSWLYRIATNVCLDLLNGRKRRALPMDLTDSSPPVIESLGSPLPGDTWLEPMPDGRVAPAADDPAEQAVARESIRLAFVAAMQELPARQRAVLILRDVLRWRATETAELLDTTVASVNSALQRARATLASRERSPGVVLDGMDAEHKALLARYVDAFERYDIDALVRLLHDDATMSMPPFALWLQGPVDIVAWMTGPGHGCRGSRLRLVAANGGTAIAQYRPGADPGSFEPWAIHALEVADGKISRLTSFLDTNLFAYFGLPHRLTEST